MSNIKRGKKKLSLVLLIVESLFVIGLCFSLALLGYFTLRTMLYQRYEFYISDMLDYVDSMIDKDDLSECMRTGVKSEKYNELQVFLDNFKDHHSVAYIYVIKPLNASDNDNIMNVIAALSTYEKEFQPEMEVGLNELTGQSYTPDVAKLYLEASQNIGEITFFEDYTEEWGNAYTGILPLVDSAGHYVAVLCVDIWINDIGEVLSLYVSSVLGVMLVLGALCVMGNMMWFNNRVIDPIIKLGNSMIAFAGSSDDNSSGNELKVIDPGITTNDEMQTLSVQAVDMMNKVIKHIERTRLATAEKERMSAELSVSTKIQRDMLPTHFPARSDFGLYALMTPAKEMGGDFYDFFMIDDDHIGLVIADVSGKGVPAAMFMIVARTLMKIRTVASGTPSEMLRDINIKLCEDNPAELFVTIWFGILTLSTGELISSNAGHEYPALMRSGGEFGLLVSENMPPVAVDSSLTYTDETIRLHKGDKLFLYTDGIPEAKNIDGFRLGTDNMLDILNRNRNKSPEELLGSVKREVDLFAGNCDQFDDITMMSLEWKADT